MRCRGMLDIGAVRSIDLGDACHRLATDFIWCLEADRAAVEGSLLALPALWRSQLLRTFVLGWLLYVEAEPLAQACIQADMLRAYPILAHGLDPARTLASPIPLGEDLDWLPPPLRTMLESMEIEKAVAAGSASRASFTML